MKEKSKYRSKLPPEKEAIRAKCFHPSGTFVEFPIEDVETSIARFEKTAAMFPDPIAIKNDDQIFTYDDLNSTANRVAGAVYLWIVRSSKTTQRQINER